MKIHMRLNRYITLNEILWKKFTNIVIVLKNFFRRTSISKLAKYKKRRTLQKLKNNGNRWKNNKQEGRYKKWRSSVLEVNKRRKGLSRHYICEKCNKKYKTSQYLHTHHIFSWHKFPKKRYTIKNGIVFCIRCHEKFHKSYGYKSIEDPKCLLEYIKDEKKYVTEYISKNLK